MNQATSTIPLVAQPISPSAFAPYGQVITARDDGQPFDQADAQLCLDRGTPRFYIMRLHGGKRRFSRITRHTQCTQCLGALEGQPWFIAVAPPTETDCPSLEAIAAFHIPGNCFIKLNLGTWHAGPYFDQATVDFYNLELSDTNLTDHFTCDLASTYHAAFEIV